MSVRQFVSGGRTFYLNPSKMTTNQILAIEKDNTDRIILLREGFFWKVYERSAFLFVTYVKKYRPSRRYIKSSGEQIINIGFPGDSLDTLLEGYERLVDTLYRVEVKSPQPVNLEDFQSWKGGVKLKMPRQSSGFSLMKRFPNLTGITSNSESVVELENDLPPIVRQKLQDFDLAHSTPVECFELVSQLQGLLKVRK